MLAAYFVYRAEPCRYFQGVVAELADNPERFAAISASETADYFFEFHDEAGLGQIRLLIRVRNESAIISAIFVCGTPLLSSAM